MGDKDLLAEFGNMEVTGNSEKNSFGKLEAKAWISGSRENVKWKLDKMNIWRKKKKCAGSEEKV